MSRRVPADELCDCPVGVAVIWVHPSGEHRLITYPLDGDTAVAEANLHADEYLAGGYCGWVAGCPRCHMLFAVCLQ